MTRPTDTGPGDPTAELLQRTLADEAATVETDPAALIKIRERTQQSPARSWRAWMLPVVGAGVATAAVITVIAVVNDDNDRDGSSVTNTPPSETATDVDPSVTPMHDGVFDPAGTNVTLYYVDTVTSPDESGGQLAFAYLYAEPHTVSDDSQLGAVREYLTSYPIDDDYVSGWPEGVDVSAIEASGSSTTIALFGDADLSSAPDLVDDEASNDSSATAQAQEMAIQGLVRTAGITEGTVLFTYNGEPLDQLLGVDVSAGVPVLPEQSEDDFGLTRAAMQITSPVEGQTLSGPIVVTGNANVWEGTVNWQLLDDQERVIDDGFTTAAFMEWLRFEVDLGTLAPGTYTFRAIEYSAINGDPIYHDDKTFTVE
jgi:hypothetical protein